MKRRYGTNEAELIWEEEIHGGRQSMHGYILTFARTNIWQLWVLNKQNLNFCVLSTPPWDHMVKIVNTNTLKQKVSTTVDIFGFIPAIPSKMTLLLN